MREQLKLLSSEPLACLTLPAYSRHPHDAPLSNLRVYERVRVPSVKRRSTQGLGHFHALLMRWWTAPRARSHSSAGSNIWVLKGSAIYPQKHVRPDTKE